MIKEITRRVNRKKIWQAIYTAGIVIPKPFAQCSYWHRNLDVKKLIDVILILNYRLNSLNYLMDRQWLNMSNNTASQVKIRSLE
jgi:hypothetical protein